MINIVSSVVNKNKLKNDYTLYYFPILGQSQAGGYNATPPLTIVSDNKVRTLTGGPIYIDVEGNLVPLVEGDTFEIYPSVETIATSLLQQLRIFRNSDYNDIYVSSVHATGGVTIQALSKLGATGRYEEIINAINRIKELCDRKQINLIVHPIFFHGGTGDNVGNTYKNKLINLYNDFDNDIKAITNQSQVFLFTHQQRPIGSPDYGIQQDNASLENPNIIVVTPEYKTTYRPDNIHLTNHGTRYLAMQWARAIYYQLFNNGFAPLRLNITGSSFNDVSKTLSIPIINIDQAVSGTSSYGIQVYSITEASIVNTNVSISGTTLNIEITDELVGVQNLEIRTAISANGELYSTTNETSSFLNISSQPYNMNKYIVRQQYQTSAEFVTGSTGTTGSTGSTNLYNIILNFGGASIADPQVSGTTSIWTNGVDQTPVVFGIGDDKSVILDNTASNYFGFTQPGTDFSGGGVTLTGSGQYANNVIGTWLFTDGNRSADIVFSGFTSASTYTFKIGGFRPDTATVRRTNYTINGVTINRRNDWTGTDNQADDDLQFAIFSEVRPDTNNSVRLRVQSDNTTFGYVNVVEISEESKANSNIFYDTVTVDNGTANLFIKTPDNVDQPPAGGWPVILYYGGDGSDVSTVKVTGATMSSGNNITYTLSPTLPTNNRILAKSVRIKVNGNVVGWGNFGGSITGSTVTGGSVSSLTNNTPTISVSFNSSQAGRTVTAEYIHSAMFIEGIPMTINQGDTLDNRCIFVGVQNAADNQFHYFSYFDNVITYLYKRFNINIKRISATGISRGGVFCIERDIFNGGSLLKSRYRFWVDNNTGQVYTTSGASRTETGIASIASIVGAYGSGFVWSNYSKIGTAFVHGTNDGTIQNLTYSIANAGNELSLQEYPQILNLWNVGHNATAWHNNYAYRKYATGGVSTTAPWDYVDFLLKYSNDDEECATLHVEQAEKRRLNTEEDIIDYRNALRKVNALPTGATKTALQSRLSNLYVDIVSGGTYYFINPHSFGNNETTPPYNNITNMLTGNSVDNIVDITGGTSTIDFDIISSPYTVVGDARITFSNRNGYTGGFTKIASNSGIKVGATGSTIGFVDLPAGTYNIRFWHNEGTGNFSANATLSVTINGVEKTQYSACNTMLGYIQFTDIDSTNLNNISIIRDADRDTGIWLIELFKQS